MSALDLARIVCLILLVPACFRPVPPPEPFVLESPFKPIALGLQRHLLTVQVDTPAGALTWGIDSGAANVVTPRVAMRLGLSKQGFLSQLLSDVSLAGIHLEPTVWVLPIAPGSGIGKRLSGLVGVGLLRDVHAVIDYDTDTLWVSEDASVVTPPEGARAIRLTEFALGMWTMPIVVDGQTGTALLDTGAFDTLLVQRSPLLDGVEQRPAGKVQ